MIDVTGLTSITAVNAILYFDVDVPELGKTVSTGYTIALTGNKVNAVISGTMSL